MVTNRERRGRRKKDKLGVWDQEMHTTMYKTDKDLLYQFSSVQSLSHV